MRHVAVYKKIVSFLTCREWIILCVGLAYALYWQAVSPIQYNGDSEGYLGVAHLLAGKSPLGMAPIYRAPGYPILLVLTGVVFPGTFQLLLLVQGLFAAMIPVIIYRILLPYGRRIAMGSAIISILTGTIAAHTSQIMTEPFYTFLLFLGIYCAVRVMREVESSSILFYGFALDFALLNATRPIGWLIFWSMLGVMAVGFWSRGQLALVWKNILGAGILFMLLMGCWSIVDDILFSVGARYSPLVGLSGSADTHLEKYLYDLPFNETYFSPWHAKIHDTETSNNQTMRVVQKIVLKHVMNNQGELLRKNTVYPYTLFGQYASQPDKLVERMFRLPNALYANYIRMVLERDLTKENRLALYAAVGHASGTGWPERWLKRGVSNPHLFLTGVEHGAGASAFLLAYTSLRYYVKNSITTQSILNVDGKKTRWMLDIIFQGMRDHPDLWQGTHSVLDHHRSSAKSLENAILHEVNQNNAWHMNMMLWMLIGYDHASALMGQAAHETIQLHHEAFLMRIWENILMVVAGPGYVQLDQRVPEFGRLEIYDYLETDQLTPRQKQELRATKYRYDDAKWQRPVQWGYFLFYCCKPLFFLTSFMSLAILWARRQAISTPLLLMLPYVVSVTIYGAIFTALPRYTDPTLLLPFIVTMMGLAECVRIHRASRVLHL